MTTDIVTRIGIGVQEKTSRKVNGLFASSAGASRLHPLPPRKPRPLPPLLPSHRHPLHQALQRQKEVIPIAVIPGVARIRSLGVDAANEVTHHALDPAVLDEIKKHCAKRGIAFQRGDDKIFAISVCL